MNDHDDSDLKDEGPQEIDLRELGDDGPSETIACPACGQQVYEDADRCPACGKYIVTGAHSRIGRFLWWVVLLAAGLVVAAWLASAYY